MFLIANGGKRLRVIAFFGGAPWKHGSEVRAVLVAVPVKQPWA